MECVCISSSIASIFSFAKLGNLYLHQKSCVLCSLLRDLDLPRASPSACESCVKSLTIANFHVRSFFGTYEVISMGYGHWKSSCQNRCGVSLLTLRKSFEGVV